MKRLFRPVAAVAAALALLIAACSALFVFGPLKAASSEAVPDEKLLEIPDKTQLFTPAAGTPPQELQTMSVAAENSRFQLLIHTETTEIALADKESGQIWRSNPAEREQDPYAKGENLELLNAQMILDCFNSYDKEVSYNTFAGSVQSGQYAIRSTENGVKVDYVIGKRWADDAALPRIISRERFEEAIIGSIESAAEQELFYDNYYGLRFVQLSPEDVRPNVVKLDQESIFGEYGVKLLDDSAVGGPALLREAVAQWTLMVAVDNGQPSRTGLTPEHFTSFRDQEFYILKDKIKIFERDEMSGILEDIGYTLEDCRVDTGNMGFKPPSENRALYKVTIEYLLRDDAFVVQVPMDEIYYPVRPSAAQRKKLNKNKRALEKEMKKLEGRLAALLKNGGGTEESDALKIQVLEKKVAVQDLDVRLNVRTAPIVNLSVLPFFGAAGEEEQGYIMVPDGSGALIRLNSRKPGASAYYKTLYGEDGANSFYEQKVQEVSQAGMPVFGLKKGASALFAVIEQGDACAGLEANVSGAASAYNTVHANFNIVPYGTTSLGGTPNISNKALVDINYRNVYQMRTYRGDIRVAYRFLYGEEADYAGMAKIYRGHLAETSGLKKPGASKDESMPLYLNLVGSVETPVNLLGLNYRKAEVKTGADDVKSIVDQLHGEGISGLSVLYSGIFSGGVQQDTLNSLSLQKGAGSWKELGALAAALKERNGRLYLGYRFTGIYRGKNQASTALNRVPAKSYGYDLVTGFADLTRFSYVVSPRLYASAAARVWNKFDSFGLGVCPEGLGAALNSDFSEQSLIDRSQTMEIVSGLFAQRKAKGEGMLMDGSHMYAAAHAAAVTGLPVTSSAYRILDESIPFTQMVLHGYVPYAGPPINFAGDKTLMVLQSVETGSYPSFRLAMDADTSGSDLKEMVAGEYGFWKADVIRIYREMEEVLGPLQHLEIKNHERPAKDLSVTSYEDGTRVVVNYRYEDASYGDTVIKARSFAVRKGAGS